jgi:hypothetical protein
MVLDTYRDEYKEICLVGRNLENKAQGNIAIAGIFIAAAFAYIEKLNLSPHPIEKFILMLAIILLGLSVTLSIFALAIRKVKSPPLSGFLHHYVPTLLSNTTGEQLRADILVVFNKNLKEWHTAAHDARQANEDKAQRLSEAQGILLAAIVLIALLTILRIFSLGGIVGGVNPAPSKGASPDGKVSSVRPRANLGEGDAIKSSEKGDRSS